MRDKILNSIKNVLINSNVIDNTTEVRGDMVAEDLGLDSLDRVEIVMSMEEIYNITINMDDVENVKTFDDLINVVLGIMGLDESSNADECNCSEKCEECGCPCSAKQDEEQVEEEPTEQEEISGGSSTITPEDADTATEDNSEEEPVSSACGAQPEA